jgi:hypothetical protein
MAQIKHTSGVPVTGRKSALRPDHCFDGITTREMLNALREHSRKKNSGKGSRDFKKNLYKEK